MVCLKQEPFLSEEFQSFLLRPVVVSLSNQEQALNQSRTCTTTSTIFLTPRNSIAMAFVNNHTHGIGDHTYWKDVVGLSFLSGLKQRAGGSIKADNGKEKSIFARVYHSSYLQQELSQCLSSQLSTSLRTSSSNFSWRSLAIYFYMIPIRSARLDEHPPTQYLGIPHTLVT